MMKYRIATLMFTTLLYTTSTLHATPLLQEKDTSQHAPRLVWHGMVNPHLYADSRQVVAGREDMMLFYPVAATLNADGEDDAATPSLHLMSITARLSLTATGPRLGNASTRAYIEGDFTGPTNATINTLRLRHAYLQLQWQQSNLLVGQYWHPMVVHEIMPGTCPLNMGAPFHPYARYSQVRYGLEHNNLQLIGVAAFQLDNKSSGPQESNPTGGTESSLRFQSRSLLPELNLQLRYCTPRLMIGMAANLLSLSPRSYVMDTLQGAHATTQRCFLPSYTLYAQYRFPNWTLRAQTLLHDNLYEISSLGGYMEQAALVDGLYQYQYRNWSYTTVWMDVSRSTGRWRPGLFVGFAHNNDFGTDTQGATVYGRGFNIEYLYRIQPRLLYVANSALSFQGEVEYTAARYGILPTGSTTYQHNEDGLVGNLRVMLSAVYSF